MRVGSLMMLMMMMVRGSCRVRMSGRKTELSSGSVGVVIEKGHDPTI